MADVKLKISTSPKVGNGWHASSAPSGTYYYKFTGGKDNRGNQAYPTGGPSHSFRVSFKGGSRADYRFAPEFYKSNDPHDQLSGQLNADNTYTVQDQCTSGCLNMVYGVYVYPVGDAEERFLCHPRISNTL